MSSGALAYNAGLPWDVRTLRGRVETLAEPDPKKKLLQSKPPRNKRLRHFAQDSFALL